MIHERKDWPNPLACFGLLMLLASLALKLRWTARTATFGYLIGFAVGAVFQTDSADQGGGAANNLWIVWTAMYLICMTAGLVADNVVKHRHIKQEGELNT